jgi:AcrR family transcriptional regulator
MAAVPVPATAPLGRPRRFDPDTEVKLILAAALVVMRRNGYEDVTVADILEEAGLSTRAFYRHFGSKDDLVLAMYRRNAEAAAERLRARVDAAGTPRQALEAWIDEILSFGYDRRKAQRVALLGSTGVQRAAGYQEVHRDAGRLLVTPLVTVLEAGLDDGSFPTAVPLWDAHTIDAVVWEVLAWCKQGDPPFPRQAALAHCLRFALPALGATGR